MFKGHAGVIRYRLAELASGSLGSVRCRNFSYSFSFSGRGTHLATLLYGYELPPSFPPQTLTIVLLLYVMKCPIDNNDDDDDLVFILYVMKCPIDIRNRSDWCCGVSGLYSSGGPRINLRMSKRRTKREQSYSVERMTRN